MREHRLRPYLEYNINSTNRLISHPAEPQCSYDPTENLILAPDTDPIEKMKNLENEISE
jgi:hypothetical protein